MEASEPTEGVRGGARRSACRWDGCRAWSHGAATRSSKLYAGVDGVNNRQASSGHAVDTVKS